MTTYIWNQLQGLFRPLLLAAWISFCLAAVAWFYGDKVGAYDTYPLTDLRIRLWVASAFLTIGTVLLVIWIVRGILRWWTRRVEEGSREPTPVEIETSAMARIFERVCAVMRERWSEEGNPVYVLPWYLVLGASGSGKTALIENSDLRLPIDHEILAALANLQGTEAARFAEWRVAGSDALLIEVNGEFFVGHEERNPIQNWLWQRFFYELQYIRPRRPLNGVILAIDLVEFAEMDNAAQDAFATRTRRILDDIVESLATQMTIHVVFTKLDQIAGFLDLFQGIDPSERDNLFGFQFTADGEQKWLDEFDAQYTEFLGRLHRILNQRMMTLKDAHRRQEAFTFARSFSGIQKSLRIFLESTLQADRFSTPPLFRGVYFMAPRLENVPHNLFLETVGERYNLPAPLYAVPQSVSKPYFASRFFKEVVFREAGLAGNNRRAEERYTRFAAALSLGISLCALSASVYWFSQYRNNITRAQAVHAQIAELKSSSGSGQNTIRQLDTFRGAMLEFGDYRFVPPIIKEMSLYKGQEIAQLADNAYRTVLHSRFIPSLVSKLEGELTHACPQGSDKQLNLLRILVMLGTPEQRNIPAIKAHFANKWRMAYPNNAATQTRLANHLDYALTVDPRPYAIDAALVQSARRDLARVTPYRRLYASLRGLGSASCQIRWSSDPLSARPSTLFIHLMEMLRSRVARREALVRQGRAALPRQRPGATHLRSKEYIQKNSFAVSSCRRCRSFRELRSKTSGSWVSRKTPKLRVPSLMSCGRSFGKSMSRIISELGETPLRP